MSSSYSANQYDGAFRSQRLQYWGQTKRARGSSRPAAQRGHTAFIADHRGHLFPGRGRRGSAWPDFRGTWDPPTWDTAAHRINPTARSQDGIRRLRDMGFTQDPQEPQETGDQEAPAPVPDPESAPGTGGDGPETSRPTSSRGPVQTPRNTESAAGPENPAHDQ